MVEIELQPQIVPIVGVAAAVYTDLRPPVGEIWVVYDLNCKHDDDGAARNCAMLIYDGTNEFIIRSLTALAHATAVYLRAETENSRPLILTRKVYFRWLVNAIGAGKSGSISSLVYTLSGLPVEA